MLGFFFQIDPQPTEKRLIHDPSISSFVVCENVLVIGLVSLFVFVVYLVRFLFGYRSW